MKWKRKRDLAVGVATSSVLALTLLAPAAFAADDCPDNCPPLTAFQAKKLIKPFATHVCVGLWDCVQARVPLMSRCQHTRFTRTCRVAYVMLDGSVCKQRLRATITYEPQTPPSKIPGVHIDQSDLADALAAAWARHSEVEAIGRTVCA